MWVLGTKLGSYASSVYTLICWAISLSQQLSLYLAAFLKFDWLYIYIFLLMHMFVCVYTHVCITNTQDYVYILICACMNYANKDIVYTYISHFLLHRCEYMYNFKSKYLSSLFAMTLNLGITKYSLWISFFSNIWWRCCLWWSLPMHCWLTR